MDNVIQKALCDELALEVVKLKGIAEYWKEKYEFSEAKFQVQSSGFERQQYSNKELQAQINSKDADCKKAVEIIESLNLKIHVLKMNLTRINQKIKRYRERIKGFSLKKSKDKLVKKSS